VGPSGSRAASAGTYILYACHVAAMAPGTHLGAATPVRMGGGSPLPGGSPPGSGDGSQGGENGQPTDAKGRKAVEDAVAYIRSLARMRGRNADWAERAVREAASLNAKQAVAENVADFEAATLTAVLEGAHGREVAVSGGTVRLNLADAQTETVTPGWRIELLKALGNPNVAYILMLVGIYGLIFELANPGAVIPGVLGGISLLLALYAFQTLPVSYAGLGLIALGILFFVGEALVPSFGALGIGGLAAFVLGSVLLMDTDVPALEIAWPVILTAAVVTGAFILAVATMAARGHRRRPVTGFDHLIGAHARAEERLAPDGHVRFEGERWRARSDPPAEAGAAVRVTAVDGLTLIVTPEQEEPHDRAE
jgi:membrane-bound serine protease (ClpP class)